MRKFEVRGGKVVLEFDGDDLQVLDAMSHRYCKNPSPHFSVENVERVKDMVCDALDFFYMGQEWGDPQGVDTPE